MAKKLGESNDQRTAAAAAKAAAHQQQQQQQPQNQQPSQSQYPQQPPTAPTLPTIDNVVSFLINDVETVSGESKHIIENSKELERIVLETHPVAGSYRICEKSVSAAEFESIIRFFESNIIKFQSLDDALRKMEFGKRFVCPKLVQRCVKDIDSRLTYANVITVYRTIRYHVAPATPAKKPMDKRTPDECLEALLYNVLQFIDMNADVVLQGEEILDANLTFAELEMILRRDTLITSEVVIYNLLAHWSRKECEKRHLEITADNRRRVLGPLSYLLRLVYTFINWK